MLRFSGVFVYAVAGMWCAGGWAQLHSADTSGDGSIGLGELLRVIQLFNSGEFHCEPGTDDGFAPGAGDRSCAPHDSDYLTPHWVVTLSELLRCIQFYNTGGYEECANSEDGYCPRSPSGDDAPEAAFLALNVSGQAPLKVQFLDISNPGGAAISAWTWDFGDGTASAEPNPEKIYNAAGTYSVSLTVSNARGSNTLVREQLISVAALSPAKLAGSSPADGEDEVAVTREIILDFTAPLDPLTVGEGVRVLQGLQSVFVFTNLSPDGRRLTLFHSTPLGGNRTIRVQVDGDALRTVDGRAVDADDNGTAGGVRTLSYTTVGLTPVAGTTVSGRVFASHFGTGEKGAPVNIPLEGVEIWVDGRFDLRATTDASGNFQLEAVPPGPFFVHINGIMVETAHVDGEPIATSFPGGPYYPFVGKLWHSVAGRDTNVGDVYLPLIPEGALTPVSGTSPTRVSLQSGGAFIIVPPNALYNDFGSRGGSVGLAAVAPDRLPSALPPGLDLPLVITVQTDGPNNFDQPVPVCFPNLPIAATGEPLPPGTPSALWSFDHDSGDWGVVGTMTVSADGAMVCSDPGAGIVEPGWHGSLPATPPQPLPPWNPMVGPFGGGRVCTVDGLACGESVFWGAFDCGVSMIPGLQQASFAVRCGWSILSNGFSVGRTCIQEDRWACGISAVAGVGGVGLDCGRDLIGAIPIVGTLLSCGTGAFDVVRNCTCLLSGVGKGTGDAAAIEEFERLLEFLEAYHTFIALELGATKWMELELNSPSLLVDSARIAAFVARLAETVDRNSDAAQAISAAEADALRALPLASGFTLADVNAVITYRNTTSEQWSLGLYTHVAAGRTDFIDENASVAALDALIAITADFAAKGGTEFDPVQTAADFYEAMIDQFTGPPDSVIPFDEIDYRLTDVSTGLSSRGRLQPGGYLRIAALSPERYYRLDLYHLPTRSYASAGFTAARNGMPTALPRVLFDDIGGEPDSDGDQLPDLAEAVYNTAPGDPDTDGDGLSDLAELEQGSNPLDGFPPGMGILANVDTPGSAQDVWAGNEMVAVADGDSGVAVFNVFNGMPPALVAQIATEAGARRVSGSGVRLAVADGPGGLAIIDVTNPILARRTAQLRSGSGYMYAVAADGNTAFGTNDRREIVVVDLLEGRELAVVPVSETMTALSASGGTLCALGDLDLRVFDITNGGLLERGMFGHGPRFLVTDVFNADPVVYYTHFDGYDTVDISDRNDPSQLGRQSGTPIGTFLSATPEGSGLVLATYTRSNAEVPLGIFDGSDPLNTESIVLEAETPGNANRVSVYNGLAYIADGDGGLTVFRYREPDTAMTPPSASFAIPGSGGSLEANQVVRVRVTAADDVQVREVGLLVNGAVADVDGSFPWEFLYRVGVPGASAQVSIAVEAVDTGGNRGQSAPQVFAVTPDMTAPVFRYSIPEEERLASNVESIRVVMNEPLDGTLNPAGFVLTSLGADGLTGGGDDAPVALAPPALSPSGTGVVVAPAAGGALAEGIYELVIDRLTLRDRSGNAAASDVRIIFGSISSDLNVPRFNHLGGGDWSDPANWSTGRVPAFNEDVVIEIPGRDVVIDIPSGNYSTRDFDSSEAIRIAAGGNLSLYGNAVLRGPVELFGTLDALGSGDVVDVQGLLAAGDSARLTVSNGASMIVHTGTTLSGVDFYVNTGSLSLPDAATLDACQVTLLGAGSVLNIPAAANIDGTYFDLDGASLNLPLVTNVEGAVVSVRTGGMVALDNLMSAGNMEIQVSGPGSAVQVASLISMHNPSVNVHGGGTMLLPALEEISVDSSGAQFALASGGLIDISSVQTLALDASMSGFASLILSSSGGGLLDCSALAAVDRTGNTSLNISVDSGGTVDLGALESLTASTYITMYSGGVVELDLLASADVIANVNGDASTLSAPALTTLTGSVTAREAVLTFPALTTLAELNLQLENGAGLIAPSVTGLSGGSITATDSALSLAPGLAAVTNVGFAAWQGGSITLPGVTSFSALGRAVSWMATGAGSLLSAPVLGGLSVSGEGGSLSVSASDAGSVALPAVTAIQTPDAGNTVSFSAAGASSLIDLESLTSFDPGQVSFTESDGGAILRP